jgi:hypothetical protein
MYVCNFICGSAHKCLHDRGCVCVWGCVCMCATSYAAAPTSVFMTEAVCVCVCMYVCVQLHMRQRPQVSSWQRLCVRVCMYVCNFICGSADNCLFGWRCTCAYVCIYACNSAHISISTLSSTHWQTEKDTHTGLVYMYAMYVTPSVVAQFQTHADSQKDTRARLTFRSSFSSMTQRDQTFTGRAQSCLRKPLLHCFSHDIHCA